ncbi:coiled-coil domain-containing protein 102A [Latimeria chalumnae]|uniref:coiled-coil domain-containing protein 102A n=1 Tax=Latimeria chalumnae TaxID=7897 RepID=UPI00313F2F1F
MTAAQPSSAKPAGPIQQSNNACSLNSPAQCLHVPLLQCQCQHWEGKSDWESCEDLHLRELKEIKARAAQMEKTMRWWSDCTANWREKWSKIRAERNKAREEARLVRQKLDTMMKELCTVRKEKQDLLHENEKLRLDVDMKLAFSGNMCQYEEYILGFPELEPDRHIRNNEFPLGQSKTNQDLEIIENTQIDNQDLRQSLDLLDSRSPAVLSLHPTRARAHLEDVEQPLGADCLKVTALQICCDDSQKILQKEREVNVSLGKQIEKMKVEIAQWKRKHEDVSKSKQEALKQLTMLQDIHQNELGRISENLEDQAGARSKMNRKICELRTELERLQAENTAEWGKRERLETEKQNLERDNKKLKVQVEELEDVLAKKSKLPASLVDSDFKAIQNELLAKKKELAELQHAHHKLRKQYQDKAAEQSYANKRVEQHEAEVKKLRVRVEELKKELAQAEDELDDSLNQIKKIQRSLDEHMEMNDSLQVQLDHLQNRLHECHQEPKQLKQKYWETP